MSDLLRIYELDEARRTILKRVPPDEFEITEGMQQRMTAIYGEPLSPEDAVRHIIRDVRTRGDDALRDWTQRIDGVMLDDLAVVLADAPETFDAVPHNVAAALAQAAMRIGAFYRQQPKLSWMQPGEEGMLGQVILPIERVGVYVPGGTAPLPSSLLMSAIPAQMAGVKELVICTPPGPDGKVPPVILHAAYLVGVDRVYTLGGAQAIAAMAYGTETVPKVDKIVGPGNLFVMLAKRQVYGAVGIDGLLGPTETMIIADEFADAGLVAADMLAQAEHDVLAQAILVTLSRDLAQKVIAEVQARAAKLPRCGILEQSLPGRGGAVIVPDLDTAFEVANSYAAEHLQLSLRDPHSWLGRVKHAGAIFLGEHSFEVLGDYIAGPSHSLPTSGTARFASGINVWDFVKVTSVIGLQADAAAKLSETAEIIARAELLDAHAAAAAARIRGGSR
jgi:histidinol dehydrogenase